MNVLFSRRVLLHRYFFIFLLSIIITDVYSQLSYVKQEDFSFIVSEKYESNIAYKIPFSGNNYKFYSSFNYHISGKAFAECKVHNTLVEAYHLSEKNCAGVNFKILKGSRHKLGRLQPNKPNKNGYSFFFMTPMQKKNKPLKHYIRTGIFRQFINYTKDGNMKSNNKIGVDFESMAQHIIDIDDAASVYGLRIKKIIFNRFYLDELYKTKAGKKLQSREIYFAKFLSKKVNKTFDDVYYIEFANQ